MPSCAMRNIRKHVDVESACEHICKLYSYMIALVNLAIEIGNSLSQGSSAVLFTTDNRIKYQFQNLAVDNYHAAAFNNRLETGYITV